MDVALIQAQAAWASDQPIGDLADDMQNLLFIFAGAGIGGVLRHVVNLGVLRLTGPQFPFGTMLINFSGSLLMGILVGLLASRAETWTPQVRLFLATGVLGGYTTFSTFSLEAVLLGERGAWGAAAAYIVGSVVLGILGLIGGLSLARSLS